MSSLPIKSIEADAKLTHWWNTITTAPSDDVIGNRTRMVDL
jgi:hypothetical protein